MARELVSKTIDGKLYEFQQYNTTQSLKMLSRLTRLMGEPVLLAVAAGYKGAKDAKPKKGAAPGKKSALDAELDPEMLARSIRELVARVGDDDEVLDLVKRLSSEGVICNHKAIEFDTHYEGADGLAHLFKVIKTALEVQYGNFTAVLIESVSASSQRPSRGIESA